jgi:hypothetical protein
LQGFALITIFAVKAKPIWGKAHLHSSKSFIQVIKEIIMENKGKSTNSCLSKVLLVPVLFIILLVSFFAPPIAGFPVIGTITAVLLLTGSLFLNWKYHI